MYKNKNPVFCGKYNIFVFRITGEMKNSYFSKNIEWLMLLRKLLKNMKKNEKKRCFKSMKQKSFFLLRIEIFFKKKSFYRLFFFSAVKTLISYVRKRKKLFLSITQWPPRHPHLFILVHIYIYYSSWTN